jgi:hypothetical protein
MPDPVVTPPVAPPQGTPVVVPPAVAPPVVPAVPAVAPPAPVAPAVGTLVTEPPAAPASAAPAEWAPVIPEGVTVDKQLLEDFTGWVKEAKIDGKNAQKLLDLQVKSQAAVAALHVETVTKWAEDTRADKDIGGANFDTTIAAAKKAVDRFCSPGMKEILTQSGLGNHKEVIRAFSQIGKLIAEDRMPGAPGGAAAVESHDDALRSAFPASPEMFATKTQ